MVESGAILQPIIEFGGKVTNDLLFAKVVQ